METTKNGLLNHRINIEQPRKGFRIAVDTVLLASAVPIQEGQQAIEFGCGVGGAMICLATRVPGISVTGIDRDRELVSLCERNIEANKVLGLKASEGDVRLLPEEFRGAFDHLFMNPPYHERDHHDVSPIDLKRTANTETSGDLALWLRSAANALKEGGCLTLIHRKDREEEILGLLKSSFGAIEICEILPREGETAKRVIMRARKGSFSTALRKLSFTLHEEDGRFTEAAESILRQALAMPF